MRKIFLIVLSVFTICLMSCETSTSSPKKVLSDPDGIAYEDFYDDVLKNRYNYTYYTRVVSTENPTPINGTGIVGVWYHEYVTNKEVYNYKNSYTFTDDGTFIYYYEDYKEVTKKTGSYSLQKLDNSFFQFSYSFDSGNNSRLVKYSYMIKDNELMLRSN